jgi:PadR family transcriptional regulator PadR
MDNLDIYGQKVLTSWEEVYKKGQLTFWLLVALKESPKHMGAIKDFITSATQGTLTADNQSMYRALRRYYDAELLDADNKPGKGGAERKVYRLSPLGIRVLEAFTERNITNVYYQPALQELLERKS